MTIMTTLAVFFSEEECRIKKYILSLRGERSETLTCPGVPDLQSLQAEGRLKP